MFPDYEYAEETTDLFSQAEEDGVFVTDYTLEVALFRTARHRSVTEVIEQLSANGAAVRRAKSWRVNPESIDEVQLLKDISEIGKGRFAQRLSSKIKGSACPESIKKAIKYVRERL